MGIPVWVRRTQADVCTAAGAGASPEPVTVPAQAAAAPKEAPEWTELHARIAACTACELHHGRTRPVPGVGNRHAEWMVIGEAPGAEEDRQGEPFVGRAGQLLSAMLLALGLPRAEVYIANIVKCRPPDNRDPQPAEAAACEPFLQRQIELIRPRIILAVGRVAAQRLLGTDAPIGRLRGRAHAHPGTAIPLIVTYHPAYLLRSPAEKRRAWEDLQLARKVLGGSS
jgi:uracil-DNA glycosylase